MRVTVDASVAVKWFVAEDHRKKARILLGPRIERYAPDLLPVECASAIWKKARRGEIRSAVSFLDEITKLPGVIRIQPGETLLREATETALKSWSSSLRPVCTLPARGVQDRFSLRRTGNSPGSCRIGFPMSK